MGRLKMKYTNNKYTREQMIKIAWRKSRYVQDYYTLVPFFSMALLSVYLFFETGKNLFLVLSCVTLFAYLWHKEKKSVMYLLDFFFLQTKEVRGRVLSTKIDMQGSRYGRSIDDPNLATIVKLKVSGKIFPIRIYISLKTIKCSMFGQAVDKGFKVWMKQENFFGYGIDADKFEKHGRKCDKDIDKGIEGVKYLEYLEVTCNVLRFSGIAIEVLEATAKVKDEYIIPKGVQDIRAIQQQTDKEKRKGKGQNKNKKKSNNGSNPM